MSTTDFGSFIELDLPTSTPVLPTTLATVPTEGTTVPTEVAIPTSTWTTQTVSEPARALALAEADIATAAGFAVDRDDLFFDEGTALAVEGHATLDREAAWFAKLPTLADAAAAHAAVIAAEQRTTSPIRLADYRLDPNGALREMRATGDRPVFGSRVVEISDHALGQARALADGTGPNPNKWLGTCAGEHRIRTRAAGRGREGFAVLSKESARGYVEYDSDRVLSEASRQLANLGLKAEVKYHAAATRLTARLLVQAPIDIPAFRGVGRVHQAGVLLRAADNGSLSIQADPFLIRIRCLNATLVQATGTRRRVRHVGDVSRMGEALRAAITDATAAVPALVALWQRAAVEHYVDEARGTQLGMREAFERLVAHDYLPKGGLGIEGAVEAYLSAWRAEDSPTSAMGVVMAAQRAAHETSWKSAWAEDEVTEAASHLLYQPVYALAEATA